MFKLEKKVADVNGTRIVNYLTEGVVYTINPYKGRDGTKILAKLTKYGSGAFGGVLRGIFTGDEETGESDDESKPSLDLISVIIAGALQDAFVDIDDPRFLHFVTDEILCSTTKNGVAFDYDIEFQNKILLAFDLIAEVIDYNFRPVFQQLDTSAFLSQLMKGK